MQSKNYNWARKTVSGLIMAALLIALIEALLRVINFDHEPRMKLLYNPTISGFEGTYQYYLSSSFAPPGYIWSSERDTPYTDSNGFRHPELSFAKPAGKIRVAFLGGSTTQGGYRPYPTRAITLLNEVTGTETYEALNVACSSYSTHQSLIALDRWVLPREPDVVLVYHGWNDIDVAGDGYSDKEKDFLLSGAGKPRIKTPNFIKRLKLLNVLQRAVETMDATWPRQRVSISDFETNLDAMAKKCAAANTKMIIMIRPCEITKPADAITRAQRAVADRYDHVEIIDGERIIHDLQTKHTPVFRRDGIHLYEYPDEILAQHVAKVIAPERSDSINSHIKSVNYVSRVASELIQDISPREAFKLIDTNTPTNTPVSSEFVDILSRARSEFEFADAFHNGRNGGNLDDPALQLDNLRRCLAMKPSDAGILRQIYFVAFDAGLGKEAAIHMSGFKPQNKHDLRDWLSFSLESHVMAQRISSAAKIASDLIQIDPDNELAQSVLKQVQAQIDRTP